MPLTRREFCLSGLGAGAALSLPGLARANSLSLRATALDHAMQPCPVTTGMMSFAPDGPPFTLRLKQSQPVDFIIQSAMDEVRIVYWHGLRIPNDQDGVP